jgi:hypothetical protein
MSVMLYTYTEITILYPPSKTKVMFTILISANYLHLQRIRGVEYKIPDNIHISDDCRQLISQIFVNNPLRASDLNYHFTPSISVSFGL